MPSYKKIAVLAALAAVHEASAAFAPSTRGSFAKVPSSTVSTSGVSSSTSLKSSQSDPLTGINSNGEAARQFRRTVYTHDDWVSYDSRYTVYIYLNVT